MSDTSKEAVERLVGDWIYAAARCDAAEQCDPTAIKAGDQMADTLRALVAEREQMADEIERLQGVLRFYADPASWQANGHPQIDADTMPVLCDRGARARAALKGAAP